MPRWQRIVRAVAPFFLLPLGLFCVVVPFWMLTLPGRGEIIDDSRAAFGAGSDAAPLRASYVDCVRERSGSNSGRGIGMTEYGCVIDLTTEPERKPEPAPTPAAPPTATAGQAGGDPYAGMSYEESEAAYKAKMEQWNAAEAERLRQYKQGFEEFAAQSRARATAPSNRLERQLASNRSGQLPVVRILSAAGEPRRIGLVWGWGEIAWRWAGWLAISLIFFLLGGGALLGVWLAWRRPPPSPTA